ncbi:MAG: hypothetical protein OEV55_07540 [candidate division Zixibacteria bacterium]|nr:hypothetical protein [candidate division Zixibacteria bacterium]
MQRKIPVLVGFVFGLFMLVQFFIPHPFFSRGYQNVLDWMQIIYVFALLVGALSFIIIHLEKISKKQKGWGYNAIAISGLLLMVFFGFYKGMHKGSPFLWIFDNLQVPMQSTMFSLLAFFVASAAYRGFRARNLQATILLLAGLLVIIGRVPLGEMIHSSIPDTATWVLNVPSMAARRGILIGIGLGTIATALRVIVGIERTYLGKG